MAIVTYGATYINGGAIPFNTPSKKGTETPKKTIRHKDIIMIGGRSIRFEYPAGHPMTIRRRSSRSDFITILKYSIYVINIIYFMGNIFLLKSFKVALLHENNQRHQQSRHHQKRVIQ